MIAGAVVKKAIAPYLVWILVVAALAIAGAGFYQGHKVGTNAQIAANQAATKKLEAKLGSARTSLRDAAVALHAASDAIDAINREAARRKREAAVAAAAERDAKNLADAFADQLRRSRASWEHALSQARGNPSCAALLDFDVIAELKRAGCPALLNGGAR